VPKGQPGVVGGGTVKYYAKIVRQEPINMREFADEIAERSTLTTPVVYTMLECLLDRMHYHMKAGRPIKLGDFGSFSPSLSSKPGDVPEDVNKNTINKVKILFRPGKVLRSRLDSLDFRKMRTRTK
ncbi:MAG: HU family DNA-binding protein, partial [Cyclobacteriaceae bacterium]|nr:HU family DNA-binding protein [Cyclobacteriaceae bacterium SS2]